MLRQRAPPGDFLQRGFVARLVQFLESVKAVARLAHYATGLTDVAKLAG